jgi:aminoglycoside phosphotransferase (APT) family kinase protein
MFVNSLLARLGLGTLDLTTATRHTGRHQNWSGVTDLGIGVFVKQVADGSPDAAGRLRRLIDLESAAWTAVARPRCLGWDVDDGLIVFELLAPARDGRQLVEDGEFDEAVAARAGRLLADLHNAACPPWLDTSSPRLPPAAELDGLSMEAFRTASAAELEVWSLLHRDRAVATAIRQLCDEPQATRTPTHCDLRLDQFLIHGNEVCLADWDEFRLADPARDIGAFVGECLFQSILRIAKGDSALSHADITAQGAAEFTAIRPMVTAFWRSYVAARDELDADFARRSVAFAGWHQFDRALAAAHERSRLLPIERAAAGIGRAALLTPERFESTLGLGE